MKYIINGKPVPLARARHGQYKVYDTQKHTKLAYGITLQSQSTLLDTYPLSGPLKLDIDFKFPIPKSTKNNNLKGTYHFYKPDNSNLVKLVEDVLTDIQFYHDDCQIAVIHATKTWDDEGSTEFTIEKL